MRNRLLMPLALAAALAAGDRSAASVFNYLASPVDVSPATGSWQDVNVSAQVPPGATGVIIEMFNTANSNYTYGLRKNGSTDTWMLSRTVAQKNHHRFFMIGIDDDCDGSPFAQNRTCQHLSTTVTLQHRHDRIVSLRNIGHNPNAVVLSDGGIRKRTVNFLNGHRDSGQTAANGIL